MIVLEKMPHSFLFNLQNGVIRQVGHLQFLLCEVGKGLASRAEVYHLASTKGTYLHICQTGGDGRAEELCFLGMSRIP